MYFGDIDVEEITDVETFKSIFFPQGFDGDTAGLTVCIIIKVITAPVKAPFFSRKVLIFFSMKTYVVGTQ